MAGGGSRPGERRGGRKKGTPNKKTQAQIEAAVGGGLTPLEYLMGIVQDDMQEQTERIDCAKAAAPYIHPKLSSIEGKVDHSLDNELAEWLSSR